MQPNNVPPYAPQGQPVQGYGGAPVAAPQKQGVSTGLIMGLVVSLLLFVAAASFGAWAFMSRQDYKSNSDAKSAAAVKAANDTQKKQLEAEFAEKEKSPLKSYTAPTASGSVKIVYPKTWSAYVSEAPDSSNMVDGSFYPDFVPSLTGKNNYYLRVQISNTTYRSAVDSFTSLAKQGKVTVAAYAPEQVKTATPGVRIDGQIDAQKKGAMVILPLRDKTIKIWTENESAISDFNNIVLKNLTYLP